MHVLLFWNVQKDPRKFQKIWQYLQNATGIKLNGRFKLDETFDRLDDSRRLFSQETVRRDVED